MTHRTPRQVKIEDTQSDRRRNRGAVDCPHSLLAEATSRPRSARASLQIRREAPSCDTITLLRQVRCATCNPQTITSRGVPGNRIPGTSTCPRRRCRTIFVHGHRLHIVALIWTAGVCGHGEGVDVYEQEGLAVFGAPLLPL